MTERLAAVLLLALAACGGQPTTQPATPSLVDGPGLREWLTAKRGQPILCNFWATWCGPCLAEMPDLLAGTREFRAAGGLVVGVAMELVVDGVTTASASAKVQQKIDQLGIDFPVLICTAEDFLSLRRAIDVELGGLPQTLAYDRDGALIAQHEGTATQDEFYELGARLLPR